MQPLIDLLERGFTAPGRIVILVSLIRDVGRRDWTHAEQELRRAMVKYPKTPSFRDILTNLLLYQNRSAEALPIARSAIVLHKKANGDAYMRLGAALDGAGNFDQAVVAFEKSLSISPTRANALYLYGQCLSNAEQFEKANRYFHECIANHPTNYVGYAGLAFSLAHELRREEAFEACQRLLATNPKNNLVLVNHIIGLGLIDRNDEARQKVQELADRNPKQVEFIEWIGMFQHVLHQNALSAETYDRYLALKPDYIRAPHGVGAVLARQGRVSEADIYFQHVIDQKKTANTDQVSRGNALLHFKRYDEALDKFREASEQMTRGKNAALVRYNIGWALQKLGRLDEAIAEYQHAIVIDDYLVAPYVGLASAHIERGRFAEADGLLLHAIKLEPLYTEAYLEMSRLETKRGNRDAAIEILNRALELEPKHQESKDELARLKGTL